MVAVAVVAVVVAVGGGDEKPLHTVTAAPLDGRCPFTGEQVSGVIGETVSGPKSSTDCSFGPGFPGVYFELLSSSACTPESRSEADGGPYSDAVDGLGVDAYANRMSLGFSLLVCNGDQPFSVLVDGMQGDDLAAAVELAGLVLNG
jgi:hypothetical protein